MGLRNWGNIAAGSELTVLGTLTAAVGVYETMHGGELLVEGIATVDPLAALAGLAIVGSGLTNTALGVYLITQGIPMVIDGWNEPNQDPC